ncbi:MAG: aspartyl protease family protein [Planctomycetota bacterium]|jgi:predicted aspartyl protease
MGITYIEATVTGPGGEKRDVNFLVDSGAVYSLLPHDVWQALGLSPKRTQTFTMADGSPIDRGISECHIALALDQEPRPQRPRPTGPERRPLEAPLLIEGHTPVILGEPGDEALLGVVTLEVLGLVFDPFKRTLHPMRMLLV